MARRGSRMPLYEMMQDRRSARDGHVERDDPPPPPAETDGWLSPGRVVRMPVGYLILAVGIIIALGAGAYMIGYERAYDDAENEFDAERFAMGGTIPPADPLRDGDSGGEVASAAPAGPPPRPAETPGGGPANDPSDDWYDIIPAVDPREAGFNYFVLIETREEGAKKVARHCRDHGLEAYAIARDNGRFRVIVLPGYRSGEASSPHVRDLKQRIHDLGEKYKRTEDATTDFYGAYAVRYEG